MEKKITQKLFDGTAKKYDSKHIKNLSSKVIDTMHINDLEQQGITSEELDWFGRNHFPVCRYRTQLTIHGTFPEGFQLREGGYKNVFRNANGSIGVRYTAVDRRKKTELFALVQYAEPDYWRVEDNSTDYCLYHQQRVTTADEYNALKARAEQINDALKPLAYAHVSAYLAQSWGVIYGVIVLNVSSFYQKNFGDILLAIISGHSRYNDTTTLISDHAKHVAEERARKEAKRKAWEAQYEQECREREKKIEQAQKIAEADLVRFGYSHYDEFDCRNKSADVVLLRSSYGNVIQRHFIIEGKNKIVNIKRFYSDLSVDSWSSVKQVRHTTWRDVWVRNIA